MPKKSRRRESAEESEPSRFVQYLPEILYATAAVLGAVAAVISALKPS